MLRELRFSIKNSKWHIEGNRKKAITLVFLACVLITLVSCSNRDHNAAYIYEINGVEQGAAIVTLSWDDLEELGTITKLVNEVASSGIIDPNIKMEYQIELVNSNGKNDFFEIGFVDGKVCCTGEVQKISFDHVVSNSITEDDLRNIIGNES